MEMEHSGVGVAVGDYNLDGHLDLFKTHFLTTPMCCKRNGGSGIFKDVTLGVGIAVETRYTAWDRGMADLDNDDLPDLLVVTGSVYAGLEKRLPSYPHATPRLLLRSLGDGRFEQLVDEAGPGVGARVTVLYENRVHTQEVHARSSFYSVSYRRLHFGLGDMEPVEVNVGWPTDAKKKIPRVAADRLIWVREGAGLIPELSVRKK